jgi:hypothetical protein
MSQIKDHPMLCSQVKTILSIHLWFLCFKCKAFGPERAMVGLIEVSYNHVTQHTCSQTAAGFAWQRFVWQHPNG